MNEFSLVQGGPLYKLWSRVRLPYRIVVPALVAWIPLLLVTMVEGHAWGDSIKLPFLYDLEMHLRLLLVLPLLIIAEPFAHQRMLPIVGEFRQRNLIPSASRVKFNTSINSAERLRDSAIAEALLIALVYFLGLVFFWRLPGEATWFGVSADGSLRRSVAGWWMVLVSLPLFQFLMLRWYFRLFIWARFLWQVSRIDLKIIPLHPDKCGGLGFLSLGVQAFLPFLLAQGALLSGMMANRIFYKGAQLPDFKLEFIGLVVVMMLAILGPQLAFSWRLAVFRRSGEIQYGTLAQQYVREFDHKWLRGRPSDESLIGSPDIQSLADLGNSFDVVLNMRLTPFSMKAVLQLMIAILLPVLPLLLTMLPLNEILARLLKLVF